MKKLSKILSFVLCLVLCLQIAAFPISAEEEIPHHKAEFDMPVYTIDIGPVGAGMVGIDLWVEDTFYGQEEILWTASDTTVVRLEPVLDTSCNVYGLNVGTTEIRAYTASGSIDVSATVEVIFEEAVFGYIDIEESEIEMQVGETRYLPYYCENLMDVAIYLFSSDESVVQVNWETQEITAVGVGTATVTASLGWTYEDTCVVNVVDNQSSSWEYNNGTLIINGNGELHGSMEEYFEEPYPWSEYAGEIERIVIGEGITTIAESAFRGFLSLETLELPSTLIRIGVNAFCDCLNLTSVKFPEGLESIEEWAFLRCENLRTVAIPDSITYIGIGAFQHCSNLEEVTLPNGIREICNDVFYGCIKLATVRIPGSVTVIADWAFGECGALAEVYYDGSQSKWTEIEIGWNNEALSNATIYYTIVDVNSVVLSQTEAQMNAGESLILTETVLPDDATDKSVVWSSSDETIATVDENGVVQAVSSGRVTITAKTADGKVSASCTVTVDGIVNKGSCGENATWTLDENGKLTISGSGAVTSSPWNAGSVVEVVIEPGITSIGAHVFEDCKNMTGVTIPESVTHIGDMAFAGCSALIHIDIPAGVIRIGISVFLDCDALVSITVDINNTEYASVDGVLFDKDMEILIQYPIGKDAISYTVPDGVITIEDNAFRGCRILIEIHIANSVEDIGDSAFRGCIRLEVVIMPDELKQLGSFAFADCEVLVEVKLPEGLKEIEDGVFSGCILLRIIVIPKGVESIGVGAFEGCSSLTDVTISITVTIIAEGAFEGCEDLVHIHYEGKAENWSDVSIGNNNASLGNAEVSYKKTLVISIVLNYFNATLKPEETINLQATVEPADADNNAVIWQSSNPSIASVDELGVVRAVSEGEATIYAIAQDGGNATASCKVRVKTPVTGVELNQESATLVAGDNLTLTATVLPEDATNKNVVWTSSDEEVATVVDGVVTAVGAGEATITVTTEDGGYTDICNITVDIARGNCGDNLTWLLEADGTLTVSGRGAMNDYVYNGAPWTVHRASIKKVIIKQGVTYIGEFAFSDCLNMETLVIEEGLEHIGERAFANCEALTQVAFPDSLKVIGIEAFISCYFLANVTFGEELTDLGSWAFAYTGLESVIVAERVTKLASGVFIHCENLTEVKLPEGLKEIGEEAFAHSGLESIEIPVGVETIGALAFENCLSLKEITIPVSVTEIGVEALAADGLIELYYDGTKTQWNTLTEGVDLGLRDDVIIHFAIVDVTGVELDMNVATLVVGENLELTATVLPEDATNKNVVWTSSDADVVTVENGVVTAVGAGSAIVTVMTEDGGYSATCVVTVDEPIPQVRPVVWVNSQKTLGGKEIVVEVSIKDCAGFADLGIEVDYDSSVMQLMAVENVFDGHGFTQGEVLEKKPFNMGWSGVSNAVYEGVLARLTFKVAEEATAGDYPITVSYYKGRYGNYEDGDDVNYDENEKPLGLSYENGVVNILAYWPGDINADETVNNRDATALLRYLAGWKNLEVNPDALDTDGNSRINNKDATNLLRYLAGWDVEVY